MADIETRLRRLLKVNAAVVGHLHVRSVLSRLAASSLELTGAGYAAVREADVAGSPIEALGPDPERARLGSDAVEVPLTMRGEPFATLVVSGHPAGRFSDDDVEMLHSLAATAAIALDKARMYEATRQRERWAHAWADVRAAGSTDDAITALLAVLPALTGAERVARTSSAPGGALALTDATGAVVGEAEGDLARAVRDRRVARLDGVPLLGTSEPRETLVFPLGDSGDAVVIARGSDSAVLDDAELAQLEDIVVEAAGTTTPDAATLGLYEELSPRERDVLLLIADGLSNRQIAERLFLSEKTVKNYVTALLRKMGMERRTQAAVYGAQLRDT